MEKGEIYQKMAGALLDLDDELVEELVQECIDAGFPALEVIVEGLTPALTILGEEYERNERFMSDLMISGQIMNDAMERLMPTGDLESSTRERAPGEHVMIIGTVQGDLHNIGKRIIGAYLSGAGIKAIDIGEDKSAAEFIDAIKKYNADVVGASAIIGPVTPYCRVIHDAMVEAGVRDKVVYITGGWGMDPEWCDEIGADAFADTTQEALEKVKGLLSGELPTWQERVGAN